MKAKTAIPYISILQIIGPILVILGHSINGLPCDGWWYVFTKEWIYIFHMPLFFMISGYLLAYNGWLRNRSYGKFIGQKALRLLLPYVVWNLVFLVPKILAASVISDSAPTDLMGLLKAFIYPRQNVLGHIGGDSFAIYIMHWPVMLVVRIAVYQFLKMPVAVTAVLMSVLGWAIPVFVIWLVRKIPVKWIQKSAKYLLGA